MKSPHAFYYSAMTLVMSLLAIFAGGAALIFAALSEQRNCALSLGLLLTLSVLSLIYNELGKPKSWSTSQRTSLR